MADDTREGETAKSETVTPSESRRPRRKRDKYDYPQSQASKMWEAFGNPSEPVNELPGGTYNSAGGKPRELHWTDAFKFSMFNKEGKPAFYQTSCARDSTLVGIIVGGGVGGLRFIVKGMLNL
jgi:cytochrome c oxidase assembly protein subunit 20